MNLCGNFVMNDKCCVIVYTFTKRLLLFVFFFVRHRVHPWRGDKTRVALSARVDQYTGVRTLLPIHYYRLILTVHCSYFKIVMQTRSPAQPWSESRAVDCASPSFRNLNLLHAETFLDIPVLKIVLRMAAKVPIFGS